ncbi:hypothetical protein [Photobacterium damselae]|uniref:Adhesin n=1 Tax=Photobacterium damselae subsp. damselae CIP 102761 TaxID=675817 RepID=D0Z5B6_PHODD|nr:hypothetical protein [Photobacterium damselae]EEZ39038.1 hypothetical protein VDA_000023 [Photobacterium damselae subsp. damselae CIP 102761]PSW79352.1 hypothetical protein CTN07_20730 [Photobacterium damselae]
MKILLIALYLFPSLAFSATVTISRGDTYTAVIPISVNKTNIYPYSNNRHAGLCVGFGMNSGYYCELRKTYDKDGIHLSIDNANGQIESTLSGLVTLTIDNGIATCGPDSKGCGIGSPWPIYSIFREQFTNNPSTPYNASINLNTVKISSAKDAIPGKHIVPVGVAVIERGYGWRVTNKNLEVVVRDVTCTLSDNSINIGTIVPGQSVTKKINLKPTCDSFLAGASWRYSNLYGNENTNLDNVSIKVKNDKNEIVNSDTPYTNVNELNDLSVEVNAKSNAEGGKLNVPLRFTLTYS